MSGVADRTDFEKQSFGTAILEGRVGRLGGFGHRTSSARQRRPSGRVVGSARSAPATGHEGRRGQRALRATWATAHPVSQQPASPTANLGSSAGAQLQPRPVAVVVLILPYLQQWRAARSPGSLARRTSVRSVCRVARGPRAGLRTGSLGPRGAVQHGRAHLWACAHRVDGVDPGSRCCLQPGEPHDRLQGATDLRRVCGASRRSREKRQGRNESRSGKPGPKASNEAEAIEQAQAQTIACPVRWTPCLAGTVASPEWTHTLDVDGGAIFETNPMRGVRQDSSCPARGGPRSRAATQ
jgi:hypothetical protein